MLHKRLQRIKPTPRQIADAAQVSMQASWRTWSKVNRRQHDAAAAADSIAAAVDVPATAIPADTDTRGARN